MEYTNRELLREGCDRLRQAGIAEADTDAWIMFSSSTGLSRTDYLMRGHDIVPQEAVDRYFEKLKRRADREPVQYIEGTAPFMGFDFLVNGNVLIPRMDTEILVSEALKLAKLMFAERPHGVEFAVLDMCTGSGCIAESVYLLLRKDGCEAAVTASDISEKALEAAKENSKRLGARVNFIQGNLFENVTGSFSMILSNPPYIRTDVIADLEPEVRVHEPVLALDGTADGLYFYRRIVNESIFHMKAGGWLMFEIGYDQAKEVSELMEKAGFSHVYVKKDLAGLDRCVCGMYNKRVAENSSRTKM